MRLQWVFSSLYASLVFVATPHVIAIHPQIIPRQVNSPFKPGPQRQAVSSHGRLPPRALIDTCASIDTGLLTELGSLMGLEFPDSVSTKSHLCLCMKDLDLYLDTNADMVILSKLAGRDTLKAFVEVLIKTSPNRKECSRVNNITHTYAAESCACIPSLCGRNCNVKPSTECIALFASTYGRVSGPAQAATEGEHGETIGRAGAGAEPCTRCLRSSERDGSVGNSCRHIPNVKEASDVGGRCVISACTVGWSPSTGRDACIRGPKVLSLRMKRVKARDTDNSDVTLDFHIVIDLTRIMRALNSLRIHSDSLRKTPTLVNTPVILVSTDEIVQAGTKLFLSHSIRSLLNHTAELLNLAQRIDTRLSDCTFGEDSGLDFVRVDVGALMDLTADILDWYRYSADGHISSDLNTSDVPITISLSQLFDVLRYTSVETTVKANSLGGGLGSDANEPLDALPIDPSGERWGGSARSLGIDSLLKQVGALVGLVLKLGDLGSLLPSSAESSTKLTTLAPVSLTTLGLVASTDISGLSNSLDFVALASSNARTTLSKDGDCGTLVDELSLIVKTAIAVRASCEEFSPSQEIDFPFPIPTLEPLPTSAPTVHASTTDTFRQPKGTPVVVVLDGLLRRLGLSSVSANMTIDGLGAGLSGTLNGVLSLLHAGGRKMVRKENSDLSSVIFSDPELAKAFTFAVEAAIDLELKSVDPGPVASLLAGLLPPVLGSLQAVLGSPTVTGLVSVVDDLLGSAKEMDTALTDCNCATAPVLESSGRFATAVMGIQSWIDEHADVIRTEGTNE